MMMRDPEEVAAEERAKKAAADKKRKEKEAIFKLWRDAYGQYYDFKYIMWLRDHFFTAALQQGAIENVETQRACMSLSSPGYPYKEVLIKRTATQEGIMSLEKIIFQWLAYRCGGAQQGSISQALAEEAAGKIDMDWSTKDLWTFPEVILLCNAYQEIYLRDDKVAGFAPPDVDKFTDIYQSHRGISEELPPSRFWDMLKDLKMEMTTTQQQQYVLDVFQNKIDRDKNGKLSLTELMHLIRALRDDQKIVPRQRENELLERSGMELADIEEWFGVFLQQAHQADPEVKEPVNNPEADEFIGLADIKSVFEGIGLKWDKSGSDKLKKWLSEVDEDYNGKIDFAEFCCLVQKMWDEDFAGIRQMTAKK